MEARVKEDKSQAHASDIPKFDSEEYVLRKRLPRRLPKRANDVYISRKTDFRAQLARHGERDVVVARDLSICGICEIGCAISNKHSAFCRLCRLANCAEHVITGCQ